MRQFKLILKACRTNTQKAKNAGPAESEDERGRFEFCLDDGEFNGGKGNRRS